MVIELLAIRPPVISDLEDIVHLNRTSLPENYPVAYFIELIKSWYETSCVAEVDNKAIGYIITRIERASITPWRPRGKSQAHIISVAVSPDHRRQGIGRKMMKYIIDQVVELSNIEKITLEVRESNHAAVEMYKQLDFYTAKVLTRYYSDGENALLMELKLN
ncbi:MAG: ribosomal protein S18-alanine N-acetyltransferase [Candidatus Kariarchaeaceae archaeon]|jgi:ribosomal-protein-alanine N-acetyltransferase